MLLKKHFCRSRFNWKEVVNVTEEGNTTVTTSEVTNTSLEAAKTAATNEGVEVKEEPAQTKETVEAAAADNKAQAEKINTSRFWIIKRLKNNTSQNKADYDKAKANYDAKLAEKALADKTNAELRLNMILKKQLMIKLQSNTKLLSKLMTQLFLSTRLRKLLMMLR